MGDAEVAGYKDGYVAWADMRLVVQRCFQSVRHGFTAVFHPSLTGPLP